MKGIDLKMASANVKFSYGEVSNQNNNDYTAPPPEENPPRYASAIDRTSSSVIFNTEAKMLFSFFDEVHYSPTVVYFLQNIEHCNSTSEILDNCNKILSNVDKVYISRLNSYISALHSGAEDSYNQLDNINDALGRTYDRYIKKISLSNDNSVVSILKKQGELTSNEKSRLYDLLKIKADLAVNAVRVNIARLTFLRGQLFFYIKNCRSQDSKVRELSEKITDVINELSNLVGGFIFDAKIGGQIDAKIRKVTSFDDALNAIKNSTLIEICNNQAAEKSFVNELFSSFNEAKRLGVDMRNTEHDLISVSGEVNRIIIEISRQLFSVKYKDIECSQATRI